MTWKRRYHQREQKEVCVKELKEEASIEGAEGDVCKISGRGAIRMGAKSRGSRRRGI